MGPPAQHWVSPDHQEVLGCWPRKMCVQRSSKNIQAWEKRRGFVSLSSGVSSSKGLGMRTVQQEERTRLGMRWEPGWG